MGTRWCLICGAEYIDAVSECPDCQLPLVDERPDQDLSDVGAGQVAYDLAGWSAESRVMLEQLLEGEGCRHAWEGTTLVVPDAIETQVDNLVEQVEVTALPTLDPDAERVAYDVSDWTDSMVSQLAQMLDQSGVPYEFDADGDIVTQVDHEERVESLMDAIEYPSDDGRFADADDDADEEVDADDAGGLPAVDGTDAVDVDVDVQTDDADDAGGDGDEDGVVDGDATDGADEDDAALVDDGPGAATVLSDLFVATDRMMKNARDAKGVLTFMAAAERSDSMRAPYGFSPVVWKDIMNQVESIRDLLEEDSSEDDDIKNESRDLRNTLREYV